MGLHRANASPMSGWLRPLSDIERRLIAQQLNVGKQLERVVGERRLRRRVLEPSGDLFPPSFWTKCGVEEPRMRELAQAEAARVDVAAQNRSLRVVVRHEKVHRSLRRVDRVVLETERKNRGAKRGEALGERFFFGTAVFRSQGPSCVVARHTGLQPIQSHEAERNVLEEPQTEGNVQAKKAVDDIFVRGVPKSPISLLHAD